MRRVVVEQGRPSGCFLECQSAPTPGNFIKGWCETNFPHVIHLPTSESEVLEPLEFKFCVVTTNITFFWVAIPCISESPSFLGNISPTSLGSKSKTSNTPTEACGLLFYP